MTEKTKPEQLAEPFDSSQLRSLSKGGTTLSYIPIAEVNARLNRVLGIGNWSVIVKRLWESGSTPDGWPVWIMAHVMIGFSMNDGADEGTFTEGVGGQKVKFSGNSPVDLGDEYKGAVSDAVKKAVQGPLGVGLDLARKDEALLWEAEANRVRADSAEVTRLTAAFDTIADEKQRKNVKKAFVSRFGPPVDLLEEQLPDACAYVETATGVALHPRGPVSEPDPVVETPETGTQPVSHPPQEQPDPTPAPPATEAAEIADEARQVGAPKEAAEVDPPVDDAPPAPSAALDTIRAHVEGLPDDEKTVFRSWWQSEVGKAFDSGLVTIPEVEQAFEYLGLDPTAASG